MDKPNMILRQEIKASALILQDMPQVIYWQTFPRTSGLANPTSSERVEVEEEASKGYRHNDRQLSDWQSECCQSLFHAYVFRLHNRWHYCLKGTEELYVLD